MRVGIGCLAVAALFVCAGTAFAQGTTSNIHVLVDVPGAQSGTFLGVAKFSGSAVDGGSAVDSLSAFIDGVFAGNVTYGISRPDVCAAYSNAPGCPDVGWSFSFDTGSLANGAHTLTISASSTTGDYGTASSSFVVANWTPGTNVSTHIGVDSPSTQHGPYSGIAGFGGWAVDDYYAISNVSISIDGVSRGNAVYGGNRQDVCNAYPNRPGCPNVGWNMSVDTTLLADGTHNFEITVTPANGQAYTQSSSFTVANLTSASPIRLSIDRPGPQDAAYSGTAAFGGWALDINTAIQKVSVSVDGVSYGIASYGGARPDVCGAYPGKAGCPNVGWNFAIDTTALANGSHVLEVTALGKDGLQGTAGATFSVSNDLTASSIHLGIDEPGQFGSTLVGVATLRGWAYDAKPATGISSVQVYLDGALAGNASYGGARPDICTSTATSINCPYVGWSYTVDTTTLASGSHRMSVTVNAADGTHASVGNTFTAGNGTAANPMNIDIDTPSAQIQTLQGVAAIGGWAIDSEAAVASIAISVDGASYGMAQYGIKRPDVCAVFPGSAGCPNVGWAFALDTTTLSNGTHTLQLTGTSSGGMTDVVTRTFRVSNPITLTVDQPGGQSAPFTGVVNFGGWAIDDNSSISSIGILIDGVPFGNAVYGINRQDVCVAFPGRAGCPNVGWNFTFDTTVVANGSHTVQVIATAANGQQSSRTVSFIANQPGIGALSAQAAGRLLDQGTWGPTPASIQDLQSKGIEKWFEEQVNAPISLFTDQPLLGPNGSGNTNLAPVQVQFFQHALNGPDQLRQRVAFALSEIWVVSALGVNYAQAFPPLLRIFENDAFGNYEQLMKDVTLNPAMGAYLNMVNNDQANPAKGTSPNENYGRELMQLFTIGLTRLNNDGTPILDSNHQSLPTYSQTDVTSMSAAMTGWTYPPQPGAVTKGHNPAYYLGAMVPVESNHDMTAKQLLGTTLPGGQTAELDLNAALNTLFMQPSLPPFICQQLIEHLVTSNPSPAYVSRVTQVFINNGSGVRGDLLSVIHAILTDPEARAGDDPNATVSPTFGHLREPVLFVANLLRGLDGTVTSSSAVASAATGIGQQLFYAPSVFSYFSPQYRLSGGLLGPEFQIYSNQNATNRVNLVNSAIYGGQFDAGTTFNLYAYTAAASNQATLLNLINQNFFRGTMSTNLQNAIAQSLAPLTAPIDKARAALYIALSSSEYQVIH